MKPSELKVSRITCGGRVVDIVDKKHGPHDHGPADPAIALRAARTAGYKPVREPHRKPKHFEVLGQRDGKLEELHIEFDGHIRTSKPVAPDHPKWSARA